MLASYDKIVKYLVEKLQLALSPLQEISKNQEIIVAQNKQIIDLLAQLNGDRQATIVVNPTSTVSEPNILAE